MSERTLFAKALLFGLNTVPKFGVPGNVLCWGSSAFCAVQTSTQHCVVGGSMYGKGRVVAFGHNGYFMDLDAHSSSHKVTNLNRLIYNSVLWSTKSECHLLNDSTCPLYTSYPFASMEAKTSIKIGGVGMDFKRLQRMVEAVSSVKSDDPVFEAVAAQRNTRIDDIEQLLLGPPLDLIIWTNANSKEEITPSATEMDDRAERLLQFVAQGGGLLVAVCPWGWNSLTGGEYLATRCVFNHFLEKCGMIYQEDYCGGDENDEYPVSVAMKAAEEDNSNAATLSKAAVELAARHGLQKNDLARCVEQIRGLPDSAFVQTRLSRRSILPASNVKTATDVSSLGMVAAAFGGASLQWPLVMKGDDQDFDTCAKFIHVPYFHRYWQTVALAQCPKAPNVAAFPGDVGLTVPRLYNHLYTINPHLEGWQTTGVYVVPGEVLSITISDQAIATFELNLDVRVGSHTDRLDIFKRNERDYTLRRYPEVTAVRNWRPKRGAEPFDIKPFTTHSGPCETPTIQVATPYGGLLYIELRGGWKNATGTPVTFNINGGVMAPYWNMQMETGEVPFNQYTDSYPHRTNPISIRALQSGAPWGELEGRYIVITMTKKALELVPDAMAMMTFWDQVIEFELALSGQRIKRKERLVHDEQISAGWAHSGYPVMAHMDGCELSENGIPKIADINHIRSSPQWGMYHEFGHNRQRGEWTWDGCGEVTVNIFSLYCTHALNGMTPYKSNYFRESVRDVSKKYLKKTDRSYRKEWQQNCNVALGTYVVLIELFGWDYMANIFRKYEQMSDKEKPKDETTRINEWIKQTSLACNIDLRPFYEQWAFPIDNSLLDELSHLEPFKEDVLTLIEEA